MPMDCVCILCEKDCKLTCILKDSSLIAVAISRSCGRRMDGVGKFWSRGLVNVGVLLMFILFLRPDDFSIIPC